MKKCDCGGTLYRHGSQQGAQRYRCKDCKKTITVRDGKRSKIVMKKDWRHEQSECLHDEGVATRTKRAIT